MADSDMRVAEAIKTLRGAARLSQAELAGRMTDAGLEMHQQTILKLERGSRSLKFTEAVVLASVLGVTLDELAFNETQPEKVGSLVRGVREIREALAVLQVARGRVIEAGTEFRAAEDALSETADRVSKDGSVPPNHALWEAVDAAGRDSLMAVIEASCG